MNKAMKDLLNKMAAKVEAGKAETDAAKKKAIVDEINALKQDYETEKALYEAEASLVGNTGNLKTNEEPKGLSDMLKSNEYAKAFAYAVRNGITPAKGGSDEKCKPLYDALTIAGGSPAGQDGGFLVPEDVDHNIRELMRQMNPLSALFTVEPVSTNSGWRVNDTAPTTGFTALATEVPAAEIAKDDQPVFGKVTYALTTYGLILPVSNELASDEAANLFAYLSRWFAKKQVITENTILKAKLELLAASNILTTQDPIGAVKSVLNKSLDPAISVNAVVLTNQSGFDYLDQQTDGMGRPILQPDPVTGTPMIFKNRRVVMMSDAMFPNRVVTAVGATKGTYYPIYLGDYRQYATLFQRQRLEVRSTDIGGKAWETNSVEVRGITRLGASVFDSAAAVRREIFIPG